MEINGILQKVWSDWEILEELGHGAYGAVYRARRQDLAGTGYAAIKVMSIPLDDSEAEALRQEGLSEAQCRAYFEDAVRDFSSEIRLMSKVRGYTNIVAIEDHKIYAHEDALRWDIFIRMELLTPLNRWLAEHPLDEAGMIRLGAELCAALEVCHRERIAHRDIKPENVFVNEAGVFKLGDFGVSRSLERHTMDLSRKGTYNYMAPEVFSGSLSEADIDSAARADLYSLGMMLYRLSNGGRLPFVPNKQLRTPADYRHALERRMSGEPLPPPESASPALAEVILRACAPRPDDRYASAADMRRALEALRSDPAPASPAVPEAAEVPPPPLPNPPKAAPTGHRPLPLAILAVLVLIAVSWAAGARFGGHPKPEPTTIPASTTVGGATTAGNAIPGPTEAGPLVARIPLSGEDGILRNLGLAAESIDGMQLRSGDTFSFNDAVGPRTAERGYVEAVNGRGASVIGGGVAQAASALWLNVKRMADVKVLSKHTYRNYNQRYVDSADDAILTDYRKGQDFSFRYDGPGAITLRMGVEDGALVCRIEHND